MQAIGNITIEEGLTLKDPTLEITTTTFDWVNDSVKIECIFKEGLYRHSRTFEFENSSKRDLLSSDVIAFIKTHSVLKVFKA